jgi:hypothetical protein
MRNETLPAENIQTIEASLVAQNPTPVYSTQVSPVSSSTTEASTLLQTALAITQIGMTHNTFKLKTPDHIHCSIQQMILFPNNTHPCLRRLLDRCSLTAITHIALTAWRTKLGF